MEVYRNMRQESRVVSDVSASPQQPDDSDDPLLSAAEATFIEAGTAQVSMDAVARQAGVSRATVYRRFGTRDALFIKVIERRAEPFLRRPSLAQSRGSLSDDLEDAMVRGVVDMPKDPLLRLLLDQGATGVRTLLTTEPMAHKVHSAINALLSRWRLRGELREDLDDVEITAWILNQQFSLVTNGPWEEEQLRRHVRLFMVPVLLVPSPEPGEKPDVTERLARIEEKIDRLVARRC